MKLSICLATYNRAGKLERTLKALERERVPGVEIVVCDNHSTDHTPEVVCEALKRMPLSYRRHESNLGPSANFRSAVEMAKGEYVWLMSDDDFLAHGCVEKVLKVLDCAYVFVNYEFFVAGQIVPTDFPVTEDARISSVDELFLKTRFANSFIGANVFRRELLLACPQEWWGNEWPQLYFACELVKHGGYVLSEPLLAMAASPVMESRAEKSREGRPTYYMDAHLQYLRFAAEVSKRMGEKARDLMLSQARDMNLAQIVYHRATTKGDGWYRLKAFCRMAMFKGLRWSPRFWLADVPTLFLPSRIA